MWSPRELAELAGTSRRAVRHYSELGLLPAPHRESNGYGRYGVDHLVRLLRIRRLCSLGLSLPQIAALGDAEQPPASLVRAVEEELAGRIEELTRARAELSGLIERPGPVELPRGVAQRVAELPAAERGLVVVLSRVLDETALDCYVGLLDAYRADASVTAFDQLPPDVDLAERVDLARGLAHHYSSFRSRHDGEVGLVRDHLRRGAPSRQRTVDQAVVELYNPAQRDVLRRVSALQTSGAPGPLRRAGSTAPGRAAPSRRPRVPA